MRKVPLRPGDMPSEKVGYAVLKELIVRVAVISPAGIHGKGGIESVVKYLVNEVRGRFHPEIDCEVIATRSTTIRWLKHPSTLLVLLKFIVLCARGRFDVIHINVAPRGSTWRKAIFAAIGRHFNLPVLLHLHGSGYDQFYAQVAPARQARIRQLFQRAERVVVLGEYWKAFVVGELGVASENVRIIANGVPSSTREHVPSEGPFRFLTLGIVGERKGTDVLLKALSQLPSGIDWKATIAGNGEVEKYRQFADELSIGDRVNFPGWIDEQGAKSLLAQSDAFVLPSRAENQPIAILEAMAQALPVISTKIGAIPEQVEEGVNGYLVRPGDVDELKSALVRLASDREGQSRMGHEGRTLFERKFSIESCAAAFVSEYRALSRTRV